MPRSPLNSQPNGQILQPGTFSPAVGATAYIYQHNTTTQVTVYAAETGSPTLIQPLTADVNGQLPGWVTTGQDLDIVATLNGQTATAAITVPVRAADTLPGQLASAATTAGQSTGLVFTNGPGLAVVIERLHLNDINPSTGAPYALPGQTSDQHAGIQAWINTLAAANGVGYVPAGNYHHGNTPIVAPVCSSLVIEGERGYNNAFGYGPLSQFVMDTDITSGAPFTTHQFDFRQVTQGAARRVTFQPPAVYPQQYGGLPCRAAGIAHGDSFALDDIAIIGGSHAVGWGGTISSSAYGFTHTYTRNLTTSNCGYGINLLTGSNAAGDQVIEGRNQINANCAGMAIAHGSGSGFTGNVASGLGLYAPIGIYLYDDGGSGQAGVADCQFFETSAELAQHGVLYDDLWAAATAGNFIDNLWAQELGANPSLTYGVAWSKSFSVTAAAGTSMTVTDGSGFLFREGMTVTNNTTSAATTIVSVAGSWPWSSATMTLAANIGSPTSVTISMPRIAAFTTGYIWGNKVGTGALFATPTGYPIYAGQSVLYNRCDDPAGSYAAATTGPPLIGGSTTAAFYVVGNQWGDGQSLNIVSERMDYAQTCVAGDLLCQAGANTYSEYVEMGRLRLHDNTRRPIGFALYASGNASSPYTSGTSVDVVTKARGCVGSAEGFVTPFRNRSGSTIAAYALLYADPAHAGGVTSTAPGSGSWTQPIGINGSSAVTTGSLGYADEIWL